VHLSQLARANGWSNPQLEPPSITLGKLALLGVGIFGFAKLVEILVDEEFEGIEFPASFRRQFIDAHVEMHGTRCLGCHRRVPRRHLTVDHIVALANGGRTSRANAQVRCVPCNSSKGARNSPVDFLRGR
jgi:hypothetical protein